MKLLLTVLTFIIFLNRTYSQGLNNGQYTFDNDDTKNISSIFLNIDTYKFFVNARISHDIDIVIEEYNNQKLVDSTKLISGLIKDIGNNFLKKNMGDDFIRIYAQNNLKTSNSVKVVFKYLNVTLPKNIDSLNLGSFQSRAFDSLPTVIQGRTPTLVLYGNKSTNLISCPGNAKIRDIVKLYDWVLVIYLEKINK